MTSPVGQHSPASDVPPDETVAIVVGVERYDINPLKWGLDGPASDAVKFVRWLREARGVPAKNIKLFASPLQANVALVDALVADMQQDDASFVAQPARESLIHEALIRWLPSRTDARLLVFYWGGHGVTGDGHDLRLYTEDVTQANRQVLNFDRVATELQTATYKHLSRQCLIVDACANYFSATTAKSAFAERRYSGIEGNGGISQLVMRAAATGEPAANDTQKQTGEFSQALRDELGKASSAPLPDVFLVANGGIVAHFERLRAAGVTAQTPVLYDYRSWKGDRGKLGDVPITHETGLARGGSDVSVRQLHRVADHLTTTARLSDRQRRDTLVASLSQTMRDTLDAARQPDDPRADVLAIVAATFGESNGFAQLLTALSALGVDDAARDLIAAELDRAQLATHVRTKLTSVSLNSSKMRELYLASLPDRQRAAPVADLDDVLSELQEFAPETKAGVPRLLEFVERVARDRNDDALRQWVEDQWVRTLKHPIQPLVDLRERLATKAAPPVATPYVQFDLVPARDGTIEYWFLGEDGSERHDRVDASPGTREAVRDAVVRVLGEDLADDLTPNTVVELFVPENYFDCDADLWEIALYPGSSSHVAAGVRWPLLLRWRERAQKQREAMPKTWGRRANDIRNRPFNPTPLWISEQDYTAATLSPRLEQPNYSCIGLKLVPGGAPREPSTELFRSTLRAGVPFAVWLRRRPPTWDDFSKEVDGAFTSALSLDDVPARMMALRKAAAAAQDHPANELSVLWDDPARNPFDDRLGLPTQAPTPQKDGNNP